MKLLLRRGADAKVFNKVDETAAELASKSGEAEVARLMVGYKADANIRNNIPSTTLEVAEYAADEDGGKAW